MSNIDTINVGGLDYSIEDTTARDQATSAITVSAYVENGNTASRAYSVIGTPVNWKGTLYYTTATIAQGATLSASNLISAVNLGNYLVTRTNRIKTYVGSDSKLHFTDATGADSVLPFKSSGYSKSQSISFVLSCPQDQSGTASGTFNQLTKVDGLLSISVSGSNVLSNLSLTGNVLSARGYNSGWGTATVSISATAFEF